jgi:hypothetical protein
MRAVQVGRIANPTYDLSKVNRPIRLPVRQVRDGLACVFCG